MLINTVLCFPKTLQCFLELEVAEVCALQAMKSYGSLLHQTMLEKFRKTWFVDYFMN